MLYLFSFVFKSARNIEKKECEVYLVQTFTLYSMSSNAMYKLIFLYRSLLYPKLNIKVRHKGFQILDTIISHNFIWYSKISHNLIWYSKRIKIKLKLKIIKIILSIIWNSTFQKIFQNSLKVLTFNCKPLFAKQLSYVKGLVDSASWHLFRILGKYEEHAVT